jgi:hypothetical protein
MPLLPRNCIARIEKVRRSEELGDFYFTWKIKVLGRNTTGMKFAFTICAPPTEYDSVESCKKIMKNLIKEFNFKVIQMEGTKDEQTRKAFNGYINKTARAAVKDSTFKGVKFHD